MDFWQRLADLAYEEHTKQEHNVIKEHINCPYDNTKYVPSVDVTVKGIEDKREHE